MSKNNRINKGLLIAFVVVQLLLTILIFVADLNDLFDTVAIKYTGVVLCFLVSLFAIKDKRSRWLILGLAGTLVADLFLLVLDKYYLVGVTAFIFVQIMYFLYIKPKRWKISLLIRMVLFIVAVLVVLFGFNVNDLTVFCSLFYFVNLVMNMVDAWIEFKNGFLVFALGLTLFIGCDVSVGFHNISSYISYSSPFIDKVIDFSQFGMWLFYLPSQTLIAISPFISKKHE